MSLQTRISSLITAIGADIKSLSTRVTSLESAGGTGGGKFVLGNTGGVVSTGVKKAYLTIPKTGNITGWKIISDVSTTATINVLASANMTSFAFLVGTSITAAQVATGSVSVAVTQGQYLDVEVISNNNATKLVLEITIT